MEKLGARPRDENLAVELKPFSLLQHIDSDSSIARARRDVEKDPHGSTAKEMAVALPGFWPNHVTL